MAWKIDSARKVKKGTKYRPRFMVKVQEVDEQQESTGRSFELPFGDCEKDRAKDFEARKAELKTRIDAKIVEYAAGDSVREEESNLAIKLQAEIGEVK